MKGVLLALVGFLLGVAYASVSENPLFISRAGPDLPAPDPSEAIPIVIDPPRALETTNDPGPKPKPIAEGGTAFNDRQAVLEYHQHSARSGNAQALYAMALRYLHGIDLPKNESLAMDYLHAARNAGEVRARDKITELARLKRQAAAQQREQKEITFLAEVEKQQN
jgi:hypothetical protein